MPANHYLQSKWHIILPIVILAGAGLVFGALLALKADPGHKEEESKAPLVSVQTLELEARNLQVRSQGIFKSQYETVLVAQVSGEIIQLAPEFERGGIVTAGSLLAQIDPFNYEVQFEDAKAQLAAAKASFVLEEAQSAVARAEWEKISDSAPTDLSLRKPQLEQAKARVKAAEAGLKQAAKNLDRTRIIAPFDALIAERGVSLGTFVSTGSRLGEVLNVSRGEVRLPLPGKDLQYLVNNGVGASVSLAMETGGDIQQWPARIARSEGLIDESSRMVYLVAEVSDPYGIHSNNQQILPFGAYVSAQIQGKHLDNVAVVPRQLVDNNKLALFSEGKLQFREVEVVRIEGSQALVTSGLQNGDQIIVSSLQFPIDGMPLELLAPQEKIEAEEGALAQEKIQAADSVGGKGETL